MLVRVLLLPSAARLPLRARDALAVVPSVGAWLARLLATAACAARRRARDKAMLWLPLAACSCRALSVASPYSVHHAAGASAAIWPACAGCQTPPAVAAKACL